MGKMARPTALMRDQKGCPGRKAVSSPSSTLQKKFHRTHHQPDLLPTDEEESQPRRRPQRSQPINHHRVNLRSKSRFRHGPLEDFIHFGNRVASSLEQRLALTILDPGIGGEPPDFDEGGAAEEETGAGVAV
jgi:hypothetical protein